MKSIAEIKLELKRTIELAEKATPRPWAKDWGRVRGDQCESICHVPYHERWDSAPWIHDAAHIANSANLSTAMARALLAAIERFEYLTSIMGTENIGRNGLEAITEAWA